MFTISPSHRSIRFMRQSIIIGGMAFFLLLAVTAVVSYRMWTLIQHEEYQTAYNVGDAARHQLELVLSNGLSATQTLELFVQQGNLPADFNSIGSKILASHKYMDAVELAPGGIVRFVYPLQENEPAIGFNILESTVQRHEAMKAIEARELVFAGPLHLVQGGFAVVGRHPVFITENGKEKFWGFSIVIIKLKTLLDAARFDELESKGYAYQLSRIHPETHFEEIFSGSNSFFPKTNAIEVQVPNAVWKLSIVPINGWRATEKVLPFILLGFLVSLLGGVFGWFWARQPLKLQTLVEQKTAELQESEERFRALFESAPVAYMSLTSNGHIVEINSEWEHLLGY
ncbi:MAG: CHASE domain-containing protein, partial [Bacteroidota bacterium]|nr:CHASE domain-containing protein [Bacteroidota bacterium]